MSSSDTGLIFALTTPPLLLFGDWVFCPGCRTYLPANHVVYWDMDPGRPRCAGCESIVQ
jgi:hypothetical protein